MARWLNIVRTNFPPNYLTVWHFHISRIQKFYCTVCQQFWKMSLYSPSITYRHHIKGYNKAYHLRNKTKRKWNGDRGRGRERKEGRTEMETGRKGKTTTENPFNSGFYKRTRPWNSFFLMILLTPAGYWHSSQQNLGNTVLVGRKWIGG